MTEFDCQRCGIHVVAIVGEPHPENLYCQECRFIEGLEGEDKRQAEEFFHRIWGGPWRGPDHG